jgi:hypothetical protein
MDLLLVSRRIGRVYIDVVRSDCQPLLHTTPRLPLDKAGEGGRLTGVEIWKLGESNED